MRRDREAVSSRHCEQSKAIQLSFLPLYGLLRGACHLYASAIALVGGAHSRDRWLAMTVLGCLKIEIPVHANTLVVPGLDPGIHQPS
jgi:hypothetical protein